MFGLQSKKQEGIQVWFAATWIILGRITRILT